MKYRVIVIALLLKNNIVAKFGDEVTAEQLSDTPELLVKGCYIEEIAAPQPSAADLQKLADEAKLQEIATAQSALDAANAALSTAQNNQSTAAPELKDAADTAVANAQGAVDAAQKALDALNVPAKAGKNK